MRVLFALVISLFSGALTYAQAVQAQDNVEERPAYVDRVMVFHNDSDFQIRSVKIEDYATKVRQEYDLNCDPSRIQDGDCMTTTVPVETTKVVRVSVDYTNGFRTPEQLTNDSEADGDSSGDLEFRLPLAKFDAATLDQIRKTRGYANEKLAQKLFQLDGPHPEQTLVKEPTYDETSCPANADMGDCPASGYHDVMDKIYILSIGVK